MKAGEIWMMNAVLVMAASQVWRIHNEWFFPRTQDLTLWLAALQKKHFCKHFKQFRRKKARLKTKSQQSLNATDFIIGQRIWTVIFIFFSSWLSRQQSMFIIWSSLTVMKGGVIFTNFRLSEFLTLVSLSTTFFLFLHTRDLNLQLSEVRSTMLAFLETKIFFLD